jgi:hypothetical protein
MKINPFVYGLLVTAVFFGTIGGFQLAGIWSTSGKVNGAGQAIQPDAGDVNSIKGWMTLEQVMTTFNVPLEELQAAFSLPTDVDPQTAIKDLESETFTVTTLKAWLETRSSSGNSPTPTGTPMSQDVPPISKIQPTATPKVEGSAPTPEGTATVHNPEPGTITGKTTYQELIDWGLPTDAIEKIIGGKVTDMGLIIKDDVVARGLEFAAIKTALQDALNSLH